MFSSSQIFISDKDKPDGFKESNFLTRTRERGKNMKQDTYSTKLWWAEAQSCTREFKQATFTVVMTLPNSTHL